MNTRFLLMLKARSAAAYTVAAAVAVTFFAPSLPSQGPAMLPYRMDLDVYRIGARAWLNGVPLYGPLPATAVGLRLPFTYPPFAAVVFSPLSLLSLGVAGLLVTLCTIAALVVPVRLYLRPLGWPLGGALAVALLLEPVRSTIQFGQVNVVLTALVAADCLAPAPRWPRGSLTGLAAAVKLTPLAFLLFFLLRRDYRGALMMSLTFIGCSALGLILAPGDSMRYWACAVFETASRIGNPQYAGNQSIIGVLTRAGLNPAKPGCLCLWLALSAAVLAVTYLGMRRVLAAGHARLALVLNAFASLLISPISWSHQWVWAVPAVLALAAADREAGLRKAWPAAACALAIFLAAPQWWFDDQPHSALWQQAVGDSYTLLAIMILIHTVRIHPPKPTAPVVGTEAPDDTNRQEPQPVLA